MSNFKEGGFIRGYRMRDIWLKHCRDTGILEGKKAGNGIFKIEITGIKRKQTAGINGIFRPNINSIRDTQTHLLGGVRNCLFSLSCYSS